MIFMGKSPLDHDHFGSPRSEVINVIEFIYLARDFTENRYPLFLITRQELAALYLLSRLKSILSLHISLPKVGAALLGQPLALLFLPAGYRLVVAGE